MSRALIGVFVAALAIRIVAALLQGLQAPPTDDAHDFDALAVNLSVGDGYTLQGQPITYRTPTVPAVLAVLYRVMGHSPAGARLLLCVINSLIVFPLSALGRRIGGAPSSLVAAWLGALFPTHVYLSPQILSDAPAALAVAVAVLLTLKAADDGRSSWQAFAAGVAWGVAALTRFTLLPVVPVAILWVAWRGGPRRVRLVRTLALAAAFASTLSPWVVRNWLTFGEPILTSPRGGLSLYYANHEGATGILSVDKDQVAAEVEARRSSFKSEMEMGEFYRERAYECISRHPGRFLELCGVRWLQFWKVWSPRVGVLENIVSIGSFGVVLALFLVGLLGRAWRRTEAAGLAAIIAVFSGLHAVYPSIVRYRLPIEPLMIVVAAGPLVSLWRAAASRWAAGAPDSPPPPRSPTSPADP